MSTLKKLLVLAMVLAFVSFGYGCCCFKKKACNKACTKTCTMDQAKTKTAEHPTGDHPK